MYIQHIIQIIVSSLEFGVRFSLYFVVATVNGDGDVVITDNRIISRVMDHSF